MPNPMPQLMDLYAIADALGLTVRQVRYRIARNNIPLMRVPGNRGLPAVLADMERFAYLDLTQTQGHKDNASSQPRIYHSRSRAANRDAVRASRARRTTARAS
jgi:hypothetical protein